MSDVIAVLIWWILLQAMGLVALPLVFRLLRWLPDRGYSVAKPAGLLLGNYVLWLLGTLGWLRNTEGGILLAFGLVALFGVWVYQRWDDGPKLLDWIRAHKHWLIAYEAVFLIALAGWAIFRAHNPDLTSTEKPMEFAFMNAIRRSPTFPAPDPWLSGFSISYYYFGYVMMSTLMKLSGVASGVAFSLSNALWFALTAAGAFGIVANLVAASKNAARNAIIGAGLIGALFVPILSNFQGPLEVAHANAIGSPEFWRGLDIQQVNTPPIPKRDGEVRWPFCDANGCPQPRYLWWWRASRVVHDYPIGSNRSDPAVYEELIDEFPFFSFLLGDNHPHVLALPFALVSLALAFNLFRMGGLDPEGDDDRVGWHRRFWTAAPIGLVYPIFLGGLSFLNTWDFPIHVFIAVVAWALGRWMTGRHKLTEVSGDALLALIACGVLGVIAYLPFYIGFRSQAGGIAPNIYNPTRWPQFFVMFGPFLVIGGTFILVLMVRAIRQRRLTAASASLGALAGGAGIVTAATVLTAMATLAVFAFSSAARAKLDEWSGLVESQGVRLDQVIVQRLSEFTVPMLLSVVVLSWPLGGSAMSRLLRALSAVRARIRRPSRLTMLRLLGMLSAMIALALLLVGLSVPLLLGVSMAAIALILKSRSAGQTDRPEQAGQGTAVPFALMLFAVGALLTFAVEYVYLLDFFGTRMNTVFKLYYQTWVLWGVASAYGVYHLLRSGEQLTSTIGRVAFASVLTVSIMGGLVYPLLAIPHGTAGRSDTPTLDARAPTRQFSPNEVAAIEWLERDAAGMPVILAAEGESYHDWTSRVSGWTGLPSVLGWVGHEGQWRGNYDDISPRQPDIDRIYTTTDPVAAMELMKKYGVTYVYVGPNEIGKYPPQGLAKFNRIMDIAFQQGDSTIYRWRGGSPSGITVSN